MKVNMEQLGGKYTKARKESPMKIPQLALTDHVASINYAIDCDGLTLSAKEPDWKKRGVKETIFIMKAWDACYQLGRGVPHLPSGFLRSRTCYALRPSLVVYL